MAKPICDGFSYTTAPGLPLGPLVELCETVKLYCDVDNDGLTIYRVPEVPKGMLRIEQKPNFISFAFSGKCVRHFIDSGYFEQLLILISEEPIRITKIHLALDRPIEPSSVIERLRIVHPRTCSLLRKPIKTRSLLEHNPWYRSDDPFSCKETGTWYAGHARVNSAAVYDKRLEVYAKEGVLMEGPLTRFEARAVKTIPLSLRDVYHTEPLFYHLMSPSILDKPDHVEAWEPPPEGSTGWVLDRSGMREITDYEKLLARVESSPDLERIIRQATKISTHGKDILLRQISDRYDSVQNREAG